MKLSLLSILSLLVFPNVGRADAFETKYTELKKIAADIKAIEEANKSCAKDSDCGSVKYTNGPCHLYVYVNEKGKTAAGGLGARTLAIQGALFSDHPDQAFEKLVCGMGTQSPHAKCAGGSCSKK